MATFNPPAEEPLVEESRLVDAPVLDGKPIAPPPTIAFTPPVATVARRPARRRYWFAAAAAAIMLVVAGALTHTYQDGLAQRQEVVVNQRDVVREIDRQLIALEPEFRSHAKAAEQKLRAEARPHLYTLAPAQLPPEGGAVVQVAVGGPDGKPTRAKITLHLTDPTGKRVLASKEVLAEHGTASVTFGEELAGALEGQQLVHLIAEARVGQRRRGWRSRSRSPARCTSPT